ncbi:hypothetical protein GJ688_06405 [Heliobacillus mobilis]|uniref:Calcineurin-like phosphoesterase domain-containing protein n=1 Tax=Heliobacterium mobile TaxID=28064 RepID=A0A6I3SIE5_HELMO|nr:metallophosphoesterase [Heliobacterium mobile]MTV48610.1 hypothetical protein [Heliobacterium mobile]
MPHTPLFSMMRLLPIVVFLAVNYLSYMALVRWLPFFRPGWRRTLFWILAFSSLFPPLYSIATGFQTQDAWLRWLYYPAFAWIMAQIIFLLAVPLVFLLSRIQRSLEQEGLHKKASPVREASFDDSRSPAGPREASPLSPVPQVHKPEKFTRRELLQGTITAVPFIALTTSLDGVFLGDRRIITRVFPVTIPGLSKNLDGLRITQVSDIHLGTFFPLDRLDDALGMIQMQKPDILTITGDFVDNLELLRPAIEKTERLSPPLGSFYCLGNHEHFRDLDQVLAAFQKSTIRHLYNQSAAINDGDLCLLGVDYPFAKAGESRPATRERLLGQALSQAPQDVPKILLSHHPDGFDEAKKSGVALTLSGHTHGGQVGIGDRSLFPWAMEYMRGWYGDDEHKLFVNSGLGHWMPFRLGCPSEIVTFVLRSS